MNNIIDENEKHRKLDITVVSIFDKEAYRKSKEYTNTEFIYIKEGKYIGKKDLGFKTTNKNLNKYVDSINNTIKGCEFDFIIMEGGFLQDYRKVLSDVPKDKCIAHIHGIYKVDEIVNSLYGYFFVISDYVREKVKESNLVKDSRIKTIYNGIKIENFNKEITDKDKIELKKRLGIKEEDNVILFCGRTIRNKGIKELIKAFKKTKNIDKTKLVIIGNSNFGEEVITEYDRELKEEAETIKENVVFTGFVPNNELYKIYGIADVAVFPTIDEEPFGLVAIEAMAAGCPVILTKSGAFPEITVGTSIPLLNKDDRLIKELTHTIDKLLENPGFREIISMEERKKVIDFSNEKFYQNFVELLQSINKEKNV